MSYNTFPLLQGLGWPIKVTPTFKTIVQQAASGAEYRTGLWQAPLHLIEVPINTALSMRRLSAARIPDPTPNTNTSSAE